jgi:hypothetical protein
MPSKDLLEIMKNHKNFYVYISDYSSFLPNLKCRVAEFVSHLGKSSIDHAFAPNDKWWFDFGYETVCRDNASEEELVNVFDTCNTSCRLLKDGKYYNCERDSVALKAGFIDSDSGFDLRDFDKKDKSALLEYSLGYSEKGYVDLCKKCNGFPPMNNNYIPAAEQIVKGGNKIL